MNEIVKSNIQLPDTLEDLTQFVLVGKAKLNAYMIKLQSVNRLNVAQEIRDQTLQEAQEVSTALIAAEQRIGELLLTIPKTTGNQYSAKAERSAKAKTKSETIKDMGYERHEALDYQQMAKNPEIVQRVINEALENGDVVTKASVMREIKATKEKTRKENNDEIKRLNNKLSDAYKQRNKLQEQIKELQEQTVRERAHNDFIAEALYFTVQCGSFIRDMGGYVWIAEHLADLPEKDRINYIKSAMAVQNWATALLQNIERNEENGKPYIDRIINESTI